MVGIERLSSPLPIHFINALIYGLIGGIRMTRKNPNVSKTGQSGRRRIGRQERHCNFVDDEGRCNRMFHTFDVKIHHCEEHRKDTSLSLTKGRNRHHQLGNQKKMSEFVEWLMFQYEVDMEQLDSISKWKKKQTKVIEKLQHDVADTILPLMQEITNLRNDVTQLQKRLDVTNRRIVSLRQEEE